MEEAVGTTQSTTAQLNVTIQDDGAPVALNVPNSLLTAVADTNSKVEKLVISVKGSAGTELYRWEIDKTNATAAEEAGAFNAAAEVKTDGTVTFNHSGDLPGNGIDFVTTGMTSIADTTAGAYMFYDANKVQVPGTTVTVDNGEVRIAGLTHCSSYTVAPAVDLTISNVSGRNETVSLTGVAGFTYTLTQNETDTSYNDVANASGEVAIANVPAGTYGIKVTNAGGYSALSTQTVTVTRINTGGGSTIPGGGGGGTTDPGEESNVKLDTQIVYMINEVSLYDFLVEGNNDTDNITVTSSNEAVATVALQDGADTRGAKYRVTTHGTGEATITVTYNGESATMDVVVYPKGGSITLDTVNYKMAPGNIYDIGVTVTDGAGTALSGEQVQQMVANGTLRVTDSRTGSIVDLTQLPNGNFRVTGKNAGTCWITYEVIQDGVAVTHASVKVDVAAGVTQGGVATRDTSWWADKSADTTTQA